MKNLDIYKDKRNKGFSFHKMPAGTNGNIAKSQAIKDMELERNKGEETYNYINHENEVLRSLEFDFVFIEIPKEI